MTTPIRFLYAGTDSSHFQATLLAYLPITLSHETHLLTVSGLLDTGSTVNVLPYAVGLQLGLVWEQQITPIYLTGNLARFPARAVIISGRVELFPPVALVFAWTQSTEVLVILGQVNFFMEFDVCFFRSQSVFEVKPKGA